MLLERIKQRIDIAFSRPKSYADEQRKPLEFQVKDAVFIKIAPMKGVMRLGKREKLSPRYTGPFKVLGKGLEKWHTGLPYHWS